MNHVSRMPEVQLLAEKRNWGKEYLQSYVNSARGGYRAGTPYNTCITVTVLPAVLSIYIP